MSINMRRGDCASEDNDEAKKEKVKTYQRDIKGCWFLKSNLKKAGAHRKLENGKQPGRPMSGKLFP